ncbi:unnamed protein product [Nippostrongylus brasiliensis]|uniref:PMEI domain-containing protein n=1 Tax=Nippostrongylus brasiliensis TaxID=27835 RepID=A0A0N4YD99_NIPBR|nr:unnamed protein product [Nippostrongylus brasiliensis]
MVSLRLIFLVTVIIISDAIGDKCENGNKEFCDLIGDAHKANEDGLKLMKLVLDGNGTKALQLADSFVVAVLKAKQSELIDGLKTALTAQLNAYDKVKADCSSSNGKCEEVLFEVGYATLGLIMAIAEVHPVAKTKTTIEDILSTLYPLMFESNASVYRDKLHASGQQILAIM